MEISQHLVDDYHNDGAVLLRGAFSGEWISRLQAAVDRDMEDPGPMVRYNTPAGGAGHFFVDFCLWERWGAVRDFVFNSPAAAIAARFMGATKVNYYHDHLIVKEPGTPERTPWHHDQPYYPLDGDQVLSFWLPLDPVPQPICVEFVKGSHLWEHWFPPQYFKGGSGDMLHDDASKFAAIPDFDARRDEFTFLSWELELGDCVVFHGRTVHGASGNPSATARRRAFATRWLGDDIRYAEREGRVSPPIQGHGLAPGDPVDSETFPVVWREP